MLLDKKTPINTTRIKKCNPKPSQSNILLKRQKMKRSLKQLYSAQLKRKQQQILEQQAEIKRQRQQELMDETSNESVSSCKTSNDIDTSNLELKLTQENKTSQQQFQDLCQSYQSIYDMILSKKAPKSQHLFSFIDITYKSLFDLSTTKLFSIQKGRKNIKEFLNEQVFINALEWRTKREKLNKTQQLFDIKIQILLRLEYGCMHFKGGRLVDPIRKNKDFEAYLDKLEIKDCQKSYDEFISYIIGKYANKFPQTFAQYYQNKEQEIPMSIACLLPHTIKPQQNKENKENESQLNEIDGSSQSTSISSTVILSQSQQTSSQPTSNYDSSLTNTKDNDPLSNTIPLTMTETLQSSEPTNNSDSRRERSRINRKRRYSDMQNEDQFSSNVDTDKKNENQNVFKAPKTSIRKRKKSRLNKKDMKNVIITPSLQAKANRNRKIVTSSSRSTLRRSQRGSALGSGNKRPLRLVLADKTNSDGIKNKKRKIDNNPSQSNTKQMHSTPTPKPLLRHAATIALVSHNSNNSLISNHSNSNNSSVFTSNANATNNLITNSAIKKRSSQWANQNRLQRKRRKRKSNRVNRKTPPLKRHVSQPNLMHNPNPLQQQQSSMMFMGSMSRTQSMNAMHDNNYMRNNKMDQDDDGYSEQRAGSLPVQNILSQQSSQNNQRQCLSEDNNSNFSGSMSLSPFQPATRSQSANDKENMIPDDAERIDGVNSMSSIQHRLHHYDDRQKLYFGDDGQESDQNDKINGKMSDDQGWMVGTDKPPSGMNAAYTAPFLNDDNHNNNFNNDYGTFVAASQTASIPPTPNNRAFTFGRGFNGGYGDDDESWGGSVERNNRNKNNRAQLDVHIPETPDNPGGSGASNIKINCRNNKRNSIGFDDGVTKRLSFGSKNPNTGD